MSINAAYQSIDETIEASSAEFHRHVYSVTIGSNKGSSTKASLNFLKSFFGSSLLMAPVAFTHSGLWLGVMLWIAITLICVSSIFLLIKTKQHIEEISPYRISTYGNVAYYLFGRAGEVVVRCHVVVITISQCVSQIIVILQCLRSGLGISHAAAMTLIFPCGLALSWIKWLKNLWMVSAIGLAAYLTGILGSTVYYGLDHYAPPEDLNEWKWSTFPLLCGCIMFNLNSCFLVLPVEDSLQNPNDAKKVIGGSLITYSVIALVFSVFAYVSGLGSCENASIVTDCLDDGILTKAVCLTLALTVLLTFPLTLYPSTEILEEMTLKGAANDEVISKVIRTGEVFASCLIALFVNDLGGFLNFVGSFPMVIIGILLPGYMYLKVFSAFLSRREVYETYLIIVSGIVLMCFGFYEL